MSVPIKCVKICPEGQACIRTENGDICLDLCPANSNIESPESECACQTKSGVAKRLQIGQYCIDGNVVKWRECENDKVPNYACYCGNSSTQGCSNPTDICHDLWCYQAECDKNLPYYHYACMCGADYLYHSYYCFYGKPLKECEPTKLATDCGCNSRLQDPRCGTHGDGKHYLCTNWQCKEASICTEDETIGQSDTCACCNADDECIYCGFGNRCVEGVCECRKAETTSAGVSHECTCGSYTCARMQLCYQGGCYNLIDDYYLQQTFEKEMLCHVPGEPDQDQGYNIIAPGKYCTVSGLQSDVPMCTKKTAPSGNCICSNTELKKCDVSETPEGKYICAISSNLSDGGYECLLFCHTSETPLQNACACGEDQGKAQIGDICMDGDYAPLLYRPCTLYHYMLSGAKGCYCSVNPVVSCTSAQYCSKEAHSCVTPPKCANGVVNVELCAINSLLCQRGNTAGNFDCLCSETSGITAIGALCMCGKDKYCGKDMAGIYFCVSGKCLPACVADGENEPQLCACDHGKEKIIVGPSEAQKTCTVECQGSYYYDQANKFCQKCDEKCAECTAEKCLKCRASNYVPDKTTCKNKGGDPVLIAGCSIAAVVVVAIIVAVVVVVVLKKKKASRTAHIGMLEPVVAVDAPAAPKNAPEVPVEAAEN